LGAKKFGIISTWIDRGYDVDPDEYKPDFVIRDLVELLGLIEANNPS
jgi:FMN phosphatase YigB (HAD superfamily)